MTIIDASIVASRGKLQTGLEWDQAILDARAKIQLLMKSIAIFEKMKADNEPWPAHLERRKRKRS